MGLQVLEYILISWTPADGGLLQNVSQENLILDDLVSTMFFQKCEPMKFIRKRCPVNRERGRMHAIHSGFFFWDKTFAKTPGETYSKKKHPENFNRPRWPTKTSSFLRSKEIKEKGSPMVTRNRILGPCQSNPTKNAKSHSMILVLSRTQGKPEGFQTYREG